MNAPQFLTSSELNYKCIASKASLTYNDKRLIENKIEVLQLAKKSKKAHDHDLTLIEI